MKKLIIFTVLALILSLNFLANTKSVSAKRIKLLDTDQDGIFDEAEIQIWNTDPDNPDTDSDGYTDGKEIKSGFNPVSATNEKIPLEELKQKKKQARKLKKSLLKEKKIEKCQSEKTNLNNQSLKALKKIVRQCKKYISKAELKSTYSQIIELYNQQGKINKVKFYTRKLKKTGNRKKRVKSKNKLKPLQTKFTCIKYSGNPVLKEQSNTHWFQWAGDPFVMKDGSTYKMWFGANVKDGITQVGYATSSDGLNWQIHPEPVLKIGENSSWDDFSVETPSVIKNSDGTYEMWYTGAGGAPEDESAGWDRLHKIGYATSEDGINWVKHSKIVLDVELEESDYGKWDFAGKADPMVIKENDTYKMWYTGAGSKNDKMVLNIGYATSSNGIDWTKHKNNPVFTRGEDKSWDYGSASTPSVFYDSEKYILLYTGINEPEKGVESGSIGYAISNDGLTWTRETTNSCLTKGADKKFDNAGVWGPTGLYNHDKKSYEIWYSALKLDSDIHVNIGQATLGK